MSELRSGPTAPRMKAPVDMVLFVLAFLATLLGTIAIWDAGYARSIRDGLGNIPREVLMQLGFAGISMIVGTAIAFVPLGKLERYSGWIMAITMVLVYAVAIPGLGLTQSGATRWIKLGPASIQPSEFAKVAVILYLAAIFARRKPMTNPGKIRHWADWIDKVGVPKFIRAMPLFVICLVALKIEREPDLGTSAVILAVMTAMFYIGGVSKKSLALLAILGLGGLLLMVKMEPYRMERILNHGHRWEAKNIDDIGFQTTQSETGMADGGALGVGFGAGRTKHVLPATTTDYIMATIGEEFGFLGSLVVLLILAGIAFRLVYLSQFAQTNFARFYLLGFASWITVQASVNLMMANGTLPPIGIPLPFFSYGGSSLLALWVAVGISQSAVVESYQKEASIAGHRYGWRHRRSRLSRA
ncbi:MAG: FtsW/RodA/SpoVE family cell cycle protein [Armatimonadetes bacterium]|nr:FtsW/RodA/SpoVE family cell cycle protein [Armatimonadota bacterium]